MGWHVPPRVGVPEGISLVFLLPYSPELQPAERAWPLVSEVVVNLLLASLGEMMEVVAEWCLSLQW
ncbi:hypothetical protein CSW51_12000 [Thermus scotoductus]|uniref:Tc1-like transposase DDE domain-containing protein n=1 Tax=Thermus scotoductus TaxID=37636 RepID=A0A430R8L1_THESC|nr:hypothetical protein CSW51_12000 [Thermus scotoductus]RTH03651.1 hypothetical protein CSW47_08110 [Thermus scotoductus]RTH97134.1 hypothetical protein CSW29_11965 [Thermus scotoductus]